MFDSLSDRLESVFKKFRGQGRLNEENVQEGLREVRLALLEADVNFKVVKDFVDRVREKALGQDVLKSLTPGQQVVKIVHDELVELLGGATSEMRLASGAPTVVMMVGLQGSGKTTSSGKLALFLRRTRKLKPMLVPADVYRPAAIEQLKKLAAQIDVPVYDSRPDMDPVAIAKDALAQAKAMGRDLVILDTAGRLHIDEPLMAELANIRDAVSPTEIFFVADAMTGQDAVNVAGSFDERLNVTGVVLTKMDGDARGGAALSIKSVTGKSVKFVGMGEKLSELEPFHPDRIASRILGMGDVLTLIEKAQAEVSEEEAQALEKKLKKAEFDFEDFRVQMRRMRKIGSLESILKLIPGMGQAMKQMGDLKVPEKEMKRVEAIIDSMTAQERRQPQIINASRKERIARGCGVKVEEVNQLIKNFEQMRQMMKGLMGGGKSPTAKALRGKGHLPGMGGLAGGKLPGGRLPAGLPGAGMPGAGMPGAGTPGMPGMPSAAGEEQRLPKSAFTKKKKSDRKKRKKR